MHRLGEVFTEVPCIIVCCLADRVTGYWPSDASIEILNASQELGNVIKQSVELWIVVLYEVQSNLFLTSLVMTEYLISDINMLGTDLFPLKFPLYNRIFTERHRQ